MSKIVNSIKEAVRLCSLKDGMTISFHHHLRSGDYVLPMVVRAISEMGYKDLTISSSSLHEGHAPMVEQIVDGTITGVDTNYICKTIGEAVGRGILPKEVIFRTHGGRPKAIENGETRVDIAFIAASSADCEGNLNGKYGPSAFGSIGYSFSDARFAKKVVVITDNLVEYPLTPVSIDQSLVDYVIAVDSIGNPEGIVAGTTKVTRDPTNLLIAKMTANVIQYSGLLKDGFNFQAGAGGTSIAVTQHVSDIMKQQQISGGFGLGGITGPFVDMLNEGLFRALFDVQCFDLKAVQSIRDNPKHIEISASTYANPDTKGCAVNNLDCVILGATEVDIDFNVNVHTDSNNCIIGGSGGHSDTAAGAKMAVVVAPLTRTRIPTIVERVNTISTPGKHIDVVVTQRGIAVNPKNTELAYRLKNAGLPVTDIHTLKERIEDITGVPRKVKTGDRIVGKVISRDGEVLDVIRSFAE